MNLDLQRITVLFKSFGMLAPVMKANSSPAGDPQTWALYQALVLGD